MAPPEPVRRGPRCGRMPCPPDGSRPKPTVPRPLGPRLQREKPFWETHSCRLLSSALNLSLVGTGRSSAGSSSDGDSSHAVECDVHDGWDKQVAGAFKKDP